MKWKIHPYCLFFFFLILRKLISILLLKYDPDRIQAVREEVTHFCSISQVNWNQVNQSISKIGYFESFQTTYFRNIKHSMFLLLLENFALIIRELGGNNRRASDSTQFPLLTGS